MSRVSVGEIELWSAWQKHKKEHIRNNLNRPS